MTPILSWLEPIFLPEVAQVYVEYLDLENRICLYALRSASRGSAQENCNSELKNFLSKLKPPPTLDLFCEAWHLGEKAIETTLSFLRLSPDLFSEKVLVCQYADGGEDENDENDEKMKFLHAILEGLFYQTVTQAPTVKRAEAALGFWSLLKERNPGCLSASMATRIVDFELIVAGKPPAGEMRWTRHALLWGKLAVPNLTEVTKLDLVHLAAASKDRKVMSLLIQKGVYVPQPLVLELEGPGEAALPAEPIAVAAEVKEEMEEAFLCLERSGIGLAEVSPYLDNAIAQRETRQMFALCCIAVALGLTLALDRRFPRKARFVGCAYGLTVTWIAKECFIYSKLAEEGKFLTLKVRAAQTEPRFLLARARGALSNVWGWASSLFSVPTPIP